MNIAKIVSDAILNHGTSSRTEKASKSYSENEMKQNLINCVSELAAQFGHASTAKEMKLWNEATIKWFNQNKK